MRLDIITIFPEYFAPLDVSLLGKARRTGILDIHVHDLRTWTHDRHRTVDDTPYGGGPGMVMKPDPWGEALDTILTFTLKPPPAADRDPGQSPSDAAGDDPGPMPGADVGRDLGPSPADAAGRGPGSKPSADDGRELGQPPSDAAGRDPGPEPTADTGRDFDPKPGAPTGHDLGTTPKVNDGPRLIVPTPSGRPFTQALAAELTAEDHLVFACGRYEGIDSRVVDEARTRMRVDEVSLGDFVLAGGEVAVLVMVEAVGRLLPGVLGNADSVTDDSFAPGSMESLLEGPVYTKPPTWRDRPVPEILLSGNHGAIARWRRDQALLRTAANRPELLAELDPESLDKHDRQVLRDAGFPVDGEGMAY